MAVAVERARTRPPEIAARPRARPARRTAPRRKVTRGVLWITVVACLLGGVVALNVAVLRLNLRMDDRNRERAQLRAEIADLSARLSRAAAVAQVETRAQKELGLVPADPAQTTFLQLKG
jgi:hypothetical protein